MSPAAGPFARRWQSVVAARRDATFLVYEDLAGERHWYSYTEFDRIISLAAEQLAAWDVQCGDRVLVCLGNSPQFLATWLATIRLGAVLVPIDPRTTPHEFAARAIAVHPQLAVAGLRNADVLEELTAADAYVPGAVVLDEDDPHVAWEHARTSARAPAPDKRPLPNGNLAAAILFTSGTTSAPKGAVITQDNYCYVGDVMSAAAALRTDDRLLVVLPLFHANAQYYSVCAAISAGASIALTARFSAGQFLLQASSLQATCASLFAAPIRMILARASGPVPPLTLRHVWYAQNISKAQYREFAGLVGCKPRQLYGMTETLAAVTTCRALDPEPGSIGRETIGATVELRSSDTGSVVATGEVGEIVVRGRPGHEIFAGYLDSGDPTVNGWFRTGDLARQDEEGNFWFVGRRGDLLKVAGENVSTVEIEAVVSEHPSVLEVAVVAVPDPILDEVPIAYVVTGEPAATAEELADWCRVRLAAYKRPREFRFVSVLPRTSVGKIKKFQLGK